MVEIRSRHDTAMGNPTGQQPGEQAGRFHIHRRMPKN
jgi:hypothetical protein